MKDRLPAPGKENRVRIRQDDGQVVEGVLDYADDATQAGSAYCKANVLPDDVCDYLGLDKKEAEPKDAFMSLTPTKLTFTNVTTAEKIKKETISKTLSEAREKAAAITIGNHALFAGGEASSGLVAIIDAYDEALTRSNPTPLSENRSLPAGAVVGNYAIFAGGYPNPAGQGRYYSDVVDAYDTSLTRTVAAVLSIARRNIAATAIGNYALFAGGYCKNGSYDATASVDAYNTSLTRSIATELDWRRAEIGAAAVGEYAIFAGGFGQLSGSTKRGGMSYVEAYDASLTKTNPTVLSAARGRMGATAVGEYALFAGGVAEHYGNGVANVEAYNRSLTRTTRTSLSISRMRLGATTLGSYALFAGGEVDADSTRSNAVESYNTSLTRATQSSLSATASWLAATVIGSYALFAGGEPSTTTMNIYSTIVAEISIPPYSKYNFAGVTNGEEQTIKGKDIVSGVPLTGYIKKITELSGRITVN